MHQHIGTHMLINIKNVPDATILEKIETIKPLLDIIVKECDLHVVAKAGHQFEPYGATYVYVLSESHLSIHTYPEKNMAYMDIFCCNPEFDCEFAAKILRSVFNCDIDYSVMLR